MFLECYFLFLICFRFFTLLFFLLVLVFVQVCLSHGEKAGYRRIVVGYDFLSLFLFGRRGLRLWGRGFILSLLLFGFVAFSRMRFRILVHLFGVHDHLELPFQGLAPHFVADQHGDHILLDVFLCLFQGVEDDGVAFPVFCVVPPEEPLVSEDEHALVTLRLLDHHKASRALHYEEERVEGEQSEGGGGSHQVWPARHGAVCRQHREGHARVGKNERRLFFVT